MANFLTKPQRDELLDELKLERSRKYADRIRVILLLDTGKTYKSIAEYLFIDESSIAHYRKRYKEGGLDGLVNDFYLGKMTMLSPEQIAILSSDLQSRIFPTTMAVISHIKKKFGVQYSRGGITELLHRIGFSFKKATPVPGKAKKEEQEKFIRKYNSLKYRGKIYFADSTHPEFAPTISYGWIKTGERFDIKTNSGWRKRVNICGAIEINSLHVIAGTYSTVNQLSICDLLKKIKENNPKKEKIFLVLDGAAYNKASSVKDLAKELKIKLVYLPPYSPNLNPIERLWKFMKKKVTANRYYEEFDVFKKSLIKFFRGIGKFHNELETLITDNFPILGT
jgi:transposase